LLTSAARTATTSTVSIYAGDVHYIPFLLRAGAPIAALGVNVVTPGSSGAIIRAGLYSLNEKGYIGNQLAATGNLDGGTTGLKIGPLASALNLPAGWYFTSITINAGSAGVTAYSSSGNNELGGSPLGFNTASPPVQIDFRTEAGGTVGVLPAVPSVTTTAHPVGQTHVPLVFLGV
jgi:hypothetical protein